MARSLLHCMGITILLFVLTLGVQSQLDPSDLDEAFFQQLLDEIVVSEKTAHLQEALVDEARQKQESARQAEETDLEDSEKMVRYRKEGQISVYNYGPSIRDQEYLEHSSLWGHQYVAGGAGEGAQRLKPDGSGRNVQVVKSDAVLPAYCNPPNPCPVGYTDDDGCLEQFENTAAFSRSYQAQQECMCDSEHMFDCPGATKDDEVNTLARQISNEGLMESALDRIAHHFDDATGTNAVDANSVPVEGQHKSLVAKKFFNKKTHADYTKSLSDKNRKDGNEQLKIGHYQKRVRRQTVGTRIMKKVNDTNRTETTAQKPNYTSKLEINPYLQGEKLPVVAKKG
ncbi:uncharacterized protein LOC111259724 [Varroa jacobsoni]|uniref:Neuroendocrine protein 7B2 n=1 Tax=Varroa destructor TaxID=109461 RepID=A0A7M7K257_VARDE|nr:uncharacterized protein LOC111249591 isoform X2 [Varroa destructor]XP_022687657.1 uncharacterized protein LOC111259724 [Varroa jacobsoni]XP_022687658.1 uncharacterized protein LOC111259724 [Varroa jacobsoni]